MTRSRRRPLSPAGAYYDTTTKPGHSSRRPGAVPQHLSIFELPLTTTVSESCAPPLRELDDDYPDGRTPISVSRTASIALAWAKRAGGSVH